MKGSIQESLSFLRFRVFRVGRVLRDRSRCSCSSQDATSRGNGTALSITGRPKVAPLRSAGPGIAAMAHAIFPFMFITTGGKCCDELQEMRKNSPGRKQMSDAIASPNQPGNYLR